MIKKRFVLQAYTLKILCWLLKSPLSHSITRTID